MGWGRGPCQRVAHRDPHGVSVPGGVLGAGGSWKRFVPIAVHGGGVTAGMPALGDSGTWRGAAWAASPQ